MDKQVLTIEQMQELIDMGVDTSNASCIWWNFADLGFASMPLNDGRSSITIEKMKENHGAENIVPTFTLQDILEMLPKPITFEDDHEADLLLGNNSLVYYETSTRMFCLEKRGENMLEAAFNMLKWCKENNYI